MADFQVFLKTRLARLGIVGVKPAKLYFERNVPILVKMRGQTAPGGVPLTR